MLDDSIESLVQFVEESVEDGSSLNSPELEVVAEPSEQQIKKIDFEKLLGILHGKEKGTKNRLARKMRIYQELGFPEYFDYVKKGRKSSLEPTGFVPELLKDYSLNDLTVLFFENMRSAQSHDLEYGIENAIRAKEFPELNKLKGDNDAYAECLGKPWEENRFLSNPFKAKTVFYDSIRQYRESTKNGSEISAAIGSVGDDVLAIGKSIASRRLWKNRSKDFDDAFSALTEERKASLNFEEQEYLSLASQFISNNKLYDNESKENILNSIKSKIDSVLGFYSTPASELSFADVEAETWNDFVETSTDTTPYVNMEDIELIDKKVAENSVLKPVSSQGNIIPSQISPEVRARYAAERELARKKAEEDAKKIDLKGFLVDNDVEVALDSLNGKAADDNMMRERLAAKEKKVEPKPVSSYEEFFDKAPVAAASEIGLDIYDEDCKDLEAWLEKEHNETYRVLICLPDIDKYRRKQRGDASPDTAIYDIMLDSRVADQIRRAAEIHTDPSLEQNLLYLEAESDIEIALHAVSLAAPKALLAKARAGYIMGRYGKDFNDARNSFDNLEKMVVVEKKIKEKLCYLLKEPKFYSLMEDGFSRIMMNFRAALEEFPPDNLDSILSLVKDLRYDQRVNALKNLKVSFKDEELNNKIKYIENKNPDKKFRVRYIAGELSNADIQNLYSEAQDRASPIKKFVGGLSSFFKSSPKEAVASSRSASDALVLPCYNQVLLPNPTGQKP